MEKDKKSNSFIGTALKAFGCFSAIMTFVSLISCGFFSILIIVIAASDISNTTDSYSTSVVQDGDEKNKIALINLEGIIWDYEDGIYTSTNTQYMLDSLNEVLNNDNYKAAIIKMNTPGGGVYDSARIADKIEEVVNAGKPVISVIEDMSASGGYWVACSTSYIFTHEESLLGSVGVLMESFDYDDLFGKIGVQHNIITNEKGVNKVPDNLNDKNSEDYKLLEDLLDESYELFVTQIKDGRNLTRDEILPYADGRLWGAKLAIEKGFVDEYGGYNDALNYVKDEIDIDNAEVIELYRPSALNFGFFSKSFVKLFSPGLISNESPRLLAVPALFLNADE